MLIIMDKVYFTSFFYHPGREGATVCRLSPHLHLQVNQLCDQTPLASLVSCFSLLRLWHLPLLWHLAWGPLFPLPAELYPWPYPSSTVVNARRSLTPCDTFCSPPYRSLC